VSAPAAPPTPSGTDRTGLEPPGYGPDFLTELFRNPLDAGYADAAARRVAAGPVRPATRRAGFLLRTVALVATGLLLAVAYQQTIRSAPEATSVRNGLVHDVQARQTETDAMQRQADALRTQAAKLRDQVVGSGAGSVLDQLEAVTGLAKVAGGGVSVTMADGPTPTDPVTGKPADKDPGRVVDFDVQAVTNQLWHDGAEAIAINGQRLTNTSTIRLAGSAILVDLVPLAQPYVIDAIGPPSMAGALRDSEVGNFYHYLSVTYGMRFDVNIEDRLTLPAAPEPQLRLATPVPPTPAATSPGTPPPSGGH
jgi:uncharacterized protein YlxW (UPF0749 family)